MKRETQAGRWLEFKKSHGKRRWGGKYFWLCKWTLCPRAGRNKKSCTLSQCWVACAVKGRCCCLREQSNKSSTLLHSSIPFLPLVCCGSFSNHQYSPESYRGPWLLQNITANILRPSPNIAKIFCPHIIVLYTSFYLASANWIFFVPFLP